MGALRCESETRARRLGWDGALFLVMFNLLKYVVKDHT